MLMKGARILCPRGLANINAIPERMAGGNLQIKSGLIKADYLVLSFSCYYNTNFPPTMSFNFSCQSLSASAFSFS